MKDFCVQDIDIERILINQYDIAFFAFGYETRSNKLFSKLNHSNITEIFIFQFKEGKNNENDELLRQCRNSHTMDCPDEDSVYVLLNAYVEKTKLENIKILIDYSSMTRLWYTAITNWAKYNALSKVSIDFVYCIGEYEAKFSPLKIDKISTLLGHEGITTYSKTVAVFGLGFDKFAALCVIDKMEPDLVLSFIASTDVHDYQPKAKSYNDEFLTVYSQNDVMYFPIKSVEKTYRLMTELISTYRRQYNILFVPMGPKPHILATILLSTKYPEITNLYVQGDRCPKPNVLPVDSFVCTKVTFGDE